MTTLPEVFEAIDKHQLVEECVEVLDQEVGEKRGLSGLAIKAGYKTVKGFKPGFLREVIGNLLPPFATALDPMYQEAKEKETPVGDFLRDNGDRVADSLLSITDKRADAADRGIVKATYGKLRPQAKKHVKQAVPRLGKLIERHAP